MYRGRIPLEPVIRSLHFTCKTEPFRSGPDETRTRVLRHARAERRFRGRSPWFVKSLRIGEFAKYLTRDVRHCSCRLSSNCRQLKSASWSKYANSDDTRVDVSSPTHKGRRQALSGDKNVAIRHLHLCALTHVHAAQQYIAVDSWRL
jgi:hypothetical protein